MRQDRAEQPQQPQLGREAEDRVPDVAGQAAVEEVPAAVSGAAGGLRGQQGGAKKRQGEEQKEASGEWTGRRPRPARWEASSRRGGQEGAVHMWAESSVADIPAWESDTQL